MNKADFLDALQTARAQWEAVLAEVGEAHMTQPGVAGEWSVKDIIAHVTWPEREMVGILQACALVGSDLWDLPQDERNAAVAAQQGDRPLHEVLAEERQVYTQLLEAVQGLSDEELLDPSHFAGCEQLPDWIPWRGLASNSFEHYRQHIPDIRAWLDAQRT